MLRLDATRITVFCNSVRSAEKTIARNAPSPEQMRKSRAGSGSAKVAAAASVIGTGIEENPSSARRGEAPSTLVHLERSPDAAASDRIR